MNCSICIYCISTFSWDCYTCYFLTCRWINKFSWCIVIHWYFYFFTIDCSLTRCELWFTALRCTLDIFCECVDTFWSNWFNCWCVSSCRWRSIRIFCLNCRWYWSTCEVFVWCECYFTCCWFDSVCTNCVSFSIFCRNCCFICWVSCSWID